MIDVLIEILMRLSLLLLKKNLLKLTINMQKLYLFVSTRKNDEITRVSVFTNSAKKAYAYAFKLFAKYNCKGEPVQLAI